MGWHVIEARAAQVGEYAAVAIVYASPHRGTLYMRTNQPDTIMNNDFMDRYAQSRYVIGHYAFTHRTARSHTLAPIPLSVYFPITYRYAEITGMYHQTYYVTEENMHFLFRPFPPSWHTVGMTGTPFSLNIYSDISKSTHFWLGDRAIVEGRFAENIHEANVSIDLAEKNNLSLGDIIEINISHPVALYPNYVSFMIVGFFSDYTGEIINELNLILPIWVPETRYIFRNRQDYEIILAGWDTISRNQILTAAPDTSYLEAINPPWISTFIDLGHETAVFYVRDLHAIGAFINDISGDLHPYMMTLDSGDTLRFIRQNITNTADAMFRVLSVTLLAGGFFNAVLLFLIFKSRVYDICVFRARGMSRMGVAAFFTVEVGIIALVAYAVAGFLYVNLYTTVLEGVARIQTGLFNIGIPTNTTDVWMNQAFQLRELELYTSSLPLLLGFAAVVIFTCLAGIGASLFIARHEPLKTMARY